MNDHVVQDLQIVAGVFVSCSLLTNLLCPDWLARKCYSPSPSPAPAAKDAASPAGGAAAVAAKKPVKSDKAILVEVKSRITSNINAFVTTGIALYLFQVYWQEFFTYPSAKLWQEYNFYAHFGTAFVVGYLMSDCLTGLLQPGLLGPLDWLHHLLVIFGYGIGLYENFGINILAILLINEGSTPFVNLHFLGNFPAGDWRRTANGLGMWLSYLFCRMLANTFLATRFVATGTTAEGSWLPGFNVPLFYFYIASFCTANCLNIVWFSKITRGLIKAAFGGKGKSSKVVEAKTQ